MTRQLSSLDPMEPLGWILDHESAMYFIKPNDESLVQIQNMLPTYLNTIKDTKHATLNILCLMLNIFTRNTTRNNANPDIGHVSDILEGLSNNLEKWVLGSRGRNITVPESVMDTVLKQKSVLLALIARQSFIVTLTRDRFSLADLSELIAQYHKHNKWYCTEDKRLLKEYIGLLRGCKSNPSELMTMALDVTYAIKNTLMYERPVDKRLFEYGDYVRTTVFQLMAQSKPKYLPNGKLIGPADTPLTIASAITTSSK